MSQSCPMCGSARTIQLDEVAVERVVDGYKNSNLRIDIRNLMPKATTAIRLLNCEDCDAEWFDPMITGDDALYIELQKNDWYYQSDKPEHAQAAALIAPKSRILEVGCGSGAFASYLDPSVSYRGLEFNAKALERAQSAGLDVTMTSIETIAEQEPGTYDVVCHFQVMEHVSDVPAFMRACVKSLREGGLLLVSVPSEDSFLRIAAASWLNMPPHHVTRWSDRALRSLYTRLGVDITDLWHEGVAAYHKNWYEATISAFALSGRSNMARILDDRDFRYRLARRAARTRFLRQRLFELGERKFPYAGRGHSVTIWGTKPMSTAEVVGQ